MRSRCPVCEVPLDPPFVARLNVPVVQNILVTSREDALAFPRGDLVLARCPRCDLVVNVAFEPRLVEYGDAYENVQIGSTAFEAHVAALVETLVRDGLRHRHVVEVGCGTGYFLRHLCERGSNTGIGFDTTYRGPDEDGPVRFVRDVYDARSRDVSADAVICRHTIEHVPDPMELIRDVAAALVGQPHAAVYFETPDLEWILNAGAFEDFFYEHCTYFTAGSLEHAFRRGGLQPLELQRVFRDQYLWLRASPSMSVETPDPESRIEAAVAAYADRERDELAEATTRLEALAQRGRVAVWGAGAKGVTFLNLIDPSHDLVDCVIDVNPRKQRCYVPGTGHPIVAPHDLARREISTALVMNPNYVGEIRTLVDAEGLNVAVEPLRGSPPRQASS